MLIACGERPVGIEVTGLETSFRPGVARDVTVKVLDKWGRQIPDAPVQWSFEPTDGGSVANDSVTFAKEGVVVVHLSSGKLTVDHSVTVQSPLAGEWAKVTSPGTDRLITFEPSGDALLALTSGWGSKRTATDIDNDAAYFLEQVNQYDASGNSLALLEVQAMWASACEQEYWPVGLHAIRDVQRMSANRWEGQALEFTSFYASDEADEMSESILLSTVPIKVRSAQAVLRDQAIDEHPDGSAVQGVLADDPRLQEAREYFEGLMGRTQKPHRSIDPLESFEAEGCKTQGRGEYRVRSLSLDGKDQLVIQEIGAVSADSRQVWRRVSAGHEWTPSDKSD